MSNIKTVYSISEMCGDVVLTYHDFDKSVEVNLLNDLYLALGKNRIEGAPYWKKFADSLCKRKYKRKNFFFDKNIDQLDSCDYALGHNIVEYMKTRAISIGHLEEVVREYLKDRIDLLECLAKLKEENNGKQLLAEYSLIALDDLKMNLANRNHQLHWETIMEKIICLLNGNMEEAKRCIQKIKNNRESNRRKDPCKEFMGIVSERRIPLVHVYDALDTTKSENAKDCFKKGIVILFNELLKSSSS